MGQTWQVRINKNLLPETKKSAARGLMLAAEHLLQVSNTHVPHEEGTLERSGVASVDEANLRAAVSYDTPYAARQHEDLTARHDEGRTSKYLENAGNSEAKTIGKIIAEQIRKG